MGRRLDRLACGQVRAGALPGVGRSILHTAADRVAPVSLELGGKSPSVVFPDSDDDATASGVLAAMRFTRQGQSCTAGSRLFVHAAVFESFLARLVGQLETLRVGNALDEESDIGALINRTQYERVCGYVDEGLAAGARAITSGRDGTGYFLRPTVLCDVDPSWRLAREEVFGPVLIALPWTDQDEMIKHANDSHYGLAAYIWTRDLPTALRTAA